MADVTSSHLLVSEYGPLLQLMKQPVFLPDPPTAFAQNALLVCTKVYLEVALLCGPVVAVRALEGLLPGVSAHVEREDAVEAEALPTQRAGILPVLAVVILSRIYLCDNALIGDSQELRQLHSPVHAAEYSCIHNLIGQKRHLVPNWVGGWGND